MGGAHSSAFSPLLISGQFASSSSFSARSFPVFPRPAPGQKKSLEVIYVKHRGGGGWTISLSSSSSPGPSPRKEFRPLWQFFLVECASGDNPRLGHADTQAWKKS